ncbi:hypothetical protein CEQ12_05065 [Staphylococcus cohnii]|nr:hypothetical protein CEQ12_05065 [Staphylococcus cohnii]
MKRTAERILAWIGIGLQLLGVIVLAIFLPLIGNGDNKNAMIQAMMEDDSSITYENGEAVINMLSALVTAGLVLSIVLLIVAIIGAVLIGKKAKAAGILLIIVGVISLIGNWITAILWLVAGIMLLVRKPQKLIYSRDEEDDANPFIKDGSQVNEHNNSYVLSENQKENEQEKIKENYSDTDEDNKYKY